MLTLTTNGSKESGQRLNEPLSTEKRVAVRIIEDASVSQQTALKAWVSGLLDIRGSDQSMLQKSKSAVSLTLSQKIIWPIVKSISKTAKTQIWDRSTPTLQFGMAASAVSLAVFGGAMAGIAALGGAIAVPLWIVIGGGSMFAKMLLDELSKRQSQ
jgi:hypothetical protein